MQKALPETAGLFAFDFAIYILNYLFTSTFLTTLCPLLRNITE